MNKIFCIFSTLDGWESVIENIKYSSKISNNKIFVLDLSDDKVAITYVPSQGNKYNNAIIMHRKTQTNTLYTINALNVIIKSKNNGVLDTTYPINWEKYKNMIVMTTNNVVNYIPTQLHKVITLG